jgi:hypothetical protein
MRRFTLINGVLRLGYNVRASFRGFIYVPIIPEGIPTLEKVRVGFEGQLKPKFKNDEGKAQFSSQT